MAPDSLPTDPVPAEHFKDAAAAVGRRAARKSDMRVAALFIAPFVLAYLVLFIYPTLKMIELSFTVFDLAFQSRRTLTPTLVSKLSLVLTIFLVAQR